MNALSNLLEALAGLVMVCIAGIIWVICGIGAVFLVAVMATLKTVEFLAKRWL